MEHLLTHLGECRSHVVLSDSGLVAVVGILDIGFDRVGIAWEEDDMGAMRTDVLERIGQAEEAFTVRRVFGEPFEKDGVTVIPAARVQGAVGGGGGEAPSGEGGTGTGFAISAKPFGVFTIKDGDVAWRPAIDVNRVILGGQLVGITALLLARAIVKARSGR